MEINGHIFDADLMTILQEVQSQLIMNGITQYFSKGFKESGNNIQVACPYHSNGQERKPSFGFHKDTGVGHCFACGATHTLPEVISYVFGQDDKLGAWGWNWLVKNFLSVDIEHRKPLDLNITRGTTQEKEVITYVSEEELDSYRYYHPYMYSRGLSNAVIERFDIGYDKNTQSITFPIRDITGGTLVIARRSVNTKWFNYPTGTTKPIYGLWELSQLDSYPMEVIICESMLDALACWVHGKYAVAMNGLGTNYQYQQLNKMPCRTFILATDNDAAGKKARLTLRKVLKNKIIKEFDYDSYPPNCKDINDMSDEEFNNLVIKL